MVELYRNKWFDRVVLTFILLNCIVMALERPDLPSESTVSSSIMSNLSLYHRLLGLAWW